MENKETQIPEARRLYQYIGRIETIFNIFANAKEDAEVGLQNMFKDKIAPLFIDPAKVGFETKLIHIQDMQEFNKAAGWVKTPITFVAPEPLKVEQSLPEERPPPDYEAIAKMLQDNGYKVTKSKSKKE